MGSSKAIAGVPVSKRALIQRINRQLAKEGQAGQMVKATRGDSARKELGDYYAVDLGRNAVVSKQVDLEDLGRKLGVLQPYERLEEDPDA
jgi:hypothetical protein